MEAILKAHSKALGSIEGRLQMISKRKGLIYDDISDRTIVCHFSQKIQDEIVSASGKRVSAYGIISYRESGEPASIKVQDFRILSRDNLPTFEDMKGILKTGGEKRSRRRGRRWLNQLNLPQH